MNHPNQNSNSSLSGTPLVAIVGRPNVGKSTLFNRLTGKWRVAVEDRPGVTRDRLMGGCRIGDHEVILMDTGGLQTGAKKAVEHKMSLQAWRGIESADFIIFVLDGRAGVTPMDREWVGKIRKIKTPKLFVINKLDTPRNDALAGEFFELNVHPMLIISAEHCRHFDLLKSEILKGLGMTSGHDKDVRSPRMSSDMVPADEVGETVSGPSESVLRIAITGRPNVGKSTLLNTLLDEDRCVVDDTPGTTRDPVDSKVTFNDQSYIFVDTAGIRRRARSEGKIETWSVVQALRVVDESDLVLLLLDGVTGPTEQDAHVAGHAFKKDKAMIVVVNKWDEGQKKFTREAFQNRLELKMNYLTHCPVLYVSAKTQKNVHKIFGVIESIESQYNRVITTSELNRVFARLIDQHPLPVFKGQQIKMYYATQAGRRPPTFLVFCNYPDKVHFSYKRYLVNALREVFGLTHIPVRVVFRGR